MVSHIPNSSNNQKHPTLPIHMQDSFGSACDCPMHTVAATSSSALHVSRHVLSPAYSDLSPLKMLLCAHKSCSKMLIGYLALSSGTTVTLP